jgi:hypothetical protein
MSRPSKFHIAIALPRIGAAPVVIAACDQPGVRRQVARVDLERAPLVRALPSGVLVRLDTGDPVRSDEVCRGCLKREGVVP